MASWEDKDWTDDILDLPLTQMAQEQLNNSTTSNQWDDVNETELIEAAEKHDICLSQHLATSTPTLALTPDLHVSKVDAPMFSPTITQVPIESPILGGSQKPESYRTWEEEMHDEGHLRKTIDECKRKKQELMEESGSHGAGIQFHILDVEDHMHDLQKGLRDILAKKLSCDPSHVTDPSLGSGLPWDDSAIYNGMKTQPSPIHSPSHSHSSISLTESQLIEEILGPASPASESPFMPSSNTSYTESQLIDQM